MQQIQTYRLVRENMLKWQREQQLNRKEMRRHKLDIYEKMQVSVDLPVSPVFKHQILNLSPVCPSCLQAPMFQVGLRFSQAMKGCSQMVETEERTAEAPEKAQNEDLLRQPKERGKV